MEWTREEHESVKREVDRGGHLDNDEAQRALAEIERGWAEIERLSSIAADCQWQHTPCAECGATQNFIGKGLYECWKCTAVELRAERDSARAELHSCGMELQTCRATLEEERRDGDAQRAEIERLTDERIEIDRTLDEAGVMVASGETTCSRVARMIADANMESERTLTAEKEAERLTAELAGQSKATLTWRDAAARHLARVEAAERDLASLRAAYEATLADLMKEQSCHRGTREALEKASALGAQAVASMGDTSIEARATAAKDIYDATVEGPTDEADLRGWLAVVRAVDASRPGLTEEQRDAWVRLRSAATAAVEAYENSDADEALEPVFEALDDALAGLATVEEEGASRGETGPAPTWGEQAIEEHRRAADLHAPKEAPAPGHVAISRAVLSRLVDATQRDPDVREAREAAEHVLHRDFLRHEPARTDPDAARRLAEARAERDRLDAKFRSYDGGDRSMSPPVSLIRDLSAAEARVRELESGGAK